MEVLAFAVQLALGVVVTARVLRFDERRLDRARLRRAWNTASFWSAVVAFGPLCIPVHFARTRRSVLGLLLGFAWAALALALLGAVDALLAWLADHIARAG